MNNIFGFILSVTKFTATDILFTLLFTLASVAVILVFVWLLTKFMGVKPIAEVADTSIKSATSNEIKKHDATKMNFAVLLAMILLIGIVLRLIFTFIIRGYMPDFNKIIGLMEYVNDNGFVGGYYTAHGVDIFPLTYYIFAFMGSLANLFGLGAESAIMPFFVKLPFIICDIVTALMLYKISKKYINNEVAIILSAFYCICPIFIFASSVWGSVYSILSLGIILSLYFLVQKNFPAIIGVYGATMLICKDAIFLFPLIGVFVVYSFIKALKITIANKPSNITAIFNNKDSAPVLIIPISIVTTTLLMYFVSLPLLINSFGGNFFKYIFQFFLKPFDALTYFSRNSLGIFNLFMRNGANLDSKFPSIIFTVIFGLLILGIVLLIYLSKKNRANLVYLAAYILITLATYFVDFNELSMLPALAILLFAYLLIKDKRILQIFGVLSIVMVLNASLVMSSGGFLNILDDYIANSTYPILSGADGIAASIICSSFAILSHLYATLVLLDISMSNKRNLLIENANSKFLKSIVNFVKIK